MSDEAIWKAVDHYIADEPAARGPGARGGAQGQQGGWAARDRRVAGAGHAAAPAGADVRRAKFSRSARWAATRRSGWRGRCPRRPARQPRVRASTHAEVARGNLQRAGLDGSSRSASAARSTSAGAGAARRRSTSSSSTPTSPSNPPVHRLGAEAVAARDGDRRRQRHPRRRGDPGPTARTRTSRARGPPSSALGSEPRLNATALQTVGAKGYDGFAIAIVKERRRLIADIAS